MARLSNIRVAILTTHGVEEVELTEPLQTLRAEGAEVHVIAPDGGDVQTMNHDEKSSTVASDRKLSDVRARDYDAVMLPGGTFNADKLRMDEDARRFVQEIDGAGKPIAAICHAPWLLVSAGLVEDRTLTSYYTLQDDIRNAGGTWVDQEAVLHRNWLTSRSPRDLPAFNSQMVTLFANILERTR